MIQLHRFCPLLVLSRRPQRTLALWLLSFTAPAIAVAAVEGGALAPTPAVVRTRDAAPVAARAADGAATPLTAPTTTNEEQPTQMAAFEVSASRVAASEIEGAQAIEHYDSTQIDDSGAFTVDEFFDTLPPAADGDEQLVLIDGQPAYLDPSMLALGMIEAIEVSLEGSMPEHGAYANGRVINIRLKKEFSSRELSGQVKRPLAGGGETYQSSWSGGMGRGKLRLLYSVEYSESEPLWATERPFSRSQDRRGLGGSDLRLPWGYPAVVQAVDGTLEALGSAVSVALVPEGAVATPEATEFVPGDPSTGVGALGQRRFETAIYRQLRAPSRQWGAAFSGQVTVTPRLNIGFEVSHRDTRSERSGAPPVSEASADTRVPAAYSPFGEEVEVGLVHEAFGPTRQNSETARTQAGLKIDGRWAKTWKWNGGVGYRRDRRSERATDLDEDAFASALASPDPARRFNPFVDARQGPQPELYSGLTALRRREQESEDYRMDLAANGEGFTAPGGPARISVRSRLAARSWSRMTQRSADADESFAEEEADSYAASASLTLPMVGADNPKAGVRRLEAQASGEYERDGDGGWEREVEGGLVWAPAKALLFRVRHSEESEAPPDRLEPTSASLVGETLIDPRRGDAVVSDVQIRMREEVAARPEQSTRTTVGATLEPSAWKGFRLSVTYGERERKHLFEDEFDAQDIVNNESAFPGRVVRAEPTAEEQAQGWPGRVLLVDTTGGNAGEAESSDATFSLDYRPPERAFGRLRVSAHARHVLDARYEIAPGQAFINQSGGRFNPPDWRFRGNLTWHQAGWTVALRAEHTGSVTTEVIDDDLPSYTEFDLNIGYRWREPLWGRFGRGLQVRAGVDNLFDREPPFADTVDGYRGGSPLGRSISLSVSVPL